MIRLVIFTVFSLMAVAASVTLARESVADASFVMAALSDARLSEQTNKEGSAVVKVTPTELSPNAEAWIFSVTFETHTRAVTGDPSAFAVLVDARGETHAPLDWQGDRPGNHHRKGVLRFRAPNQRDGTIELRLRNVGDVAERVFRWELGAPTTR
jgi:hypothetical protein